MKNPLTLLVMLCVAAFLTLPLALGNPWVSAAASWIVRFVRGMLMICIVGLVFSLLAVWILTEQPKEAMTGGAKPGVVEAKPSLSGLQVLTLIDASQHPPGSVVSGIKWRPGFTALRVSLSNPTDEDFKEVDVVLEPNEPIAAIGQVSTVAGVSLIGDITKEQVYIDGTLLTMPLATIKEIDGTVNTIPLSQVLTSQYRVRCPLLPKNSDLQLLIAIAEANEKPPPGVLYFGMSRENKQGITDKRIIFVPMGDLDRVVFTPKLPTKIRVHGAYLVNLSSKTIDTTVDIKREQVGGTKTK